MNGIEEIDKAKWRTDSYGVKELSVHDKIGREVICYLSLRPVYCDRGHLQLNIEGPLDLDSADSFPRFFFSFKEADQHTRDFLKWRLWKHRVHLHAL